MTSIMQHILTLDHLFMWNYVEETEVDVTECVF